MNPGLEPDITPHDLELAIIVRTPTTWPTQVHDILLCIFDDGDFLEVGGQAGLAITTGYARVDGRPVGVIANQPMHVSGAIHNEASDKAATFIRFCHALNTPLVFVVDTPRVLPGAEQEKNGIIKRGGRVPFPVGEADVPKVTVSIRKSYGGAHAGMSSKQIAAAYRSATVAGIAPHWNRFTLPAN